MGAFIPLMGKTFGYLTVVSREENGPRNRARWNCICSCGNATTVESCRLVGGYTKSCGCYARELARKGDSRRTHGLSQTNEYNAWTQIKRRCLNSRSKDYAKYGGRGISICEKWLSYEGFLADMGKRPTAKHSIDRIDNDGNYEPGNCRWATYTEQNRNRRNTLFVTIDEVTRPLREWSEISGINHVCIYERLRQGVDAKRAVFSPLGTKGLWRTRPFIRRALQPQVVP